MRSTGLSSPVRSNKDNAPRSSGRVLNTTVLDSEKLDRRREPTCLNRTYRSDAITRFGDGDRPQRHGGLISI